MEASVKELEKIAFERGLAEEKIVTDEMPRPQTLVRGEQVNKSWHRKGEPNFHARILIIDDDPDFRIMLTKMLQGVGYAVIEAANGREGLMRQFAMICKKA